MNKNLTFLIIFFLFVIKGFSQAPNINYTSSQKYFTGQTIAPLTPTNTGGAVPATVYGQVTTFAGSSNSGYADGTGTDAKFNSPGGLTADANGNIYVADISNNRIRKITPAGVVTTIAGSTAGFLNATGTAAKFNAPEDVALDAAGNIFVTDFTNNMIRKITPASVVTTFAGSQSSGFVNGTGTAARFNSPIGITTDATGNLYVADNSNNSIRKITPAGVVTTFAGNGSRGFVNATGTAASFNSPQNLVADGAGNIYVTDGDNSSIRKITPSGVVTTFVSSGATGITIDALGNLYVAGTTSISKITPAGTATILAGNALNSTIDGVGTAAGFSYLDDMVADKAGNLYASQTGAIRKISLTGYSISPALPTGLNFDATTGIISGTPSVSSPATNYTISAYNTSGSSSYTVNIAVVAASDATLSSLVPSSGALTPTFTSDVTHYAIKVPDGTTSFALTPTANNPNSTIKVNGITVINGTQSPNIPLVPGPNTISVKVTAPNGNAQTYFVVINGTVGSNANLSSIQLSAGALSPVFSSNVIEYTAMFRTNTYSFYLTLTSSDSTATIKVNGMPVASGTAILIPFVPNPYVVVPTTSQPVFIVVTAQDGTVKNYYIMAETDYSTAIIDVSLSSGTLSPIFDNYKTSYTSTVDNNVTSVVVTALINDNSATFKINGTTVPSKLMGLNVATSNPIPLTVGNNTINVAINGPLRGSFYYTVVVTRVASSNAKLKALELSAGALSPIFLSDTANYTTTVANGVKSVTVKPVASDSSATVKVNGVQVASGAVSAAVPLLIGKNTIITQLTAQDGTIKTYTVVVTRLPSSNADLVLLKPSAGKISPEFTSTVIAYTDTVANQVSLITLTPVISDSTATIKVNGVAVASNTSSNATPLAIGSNTISTVVTAQDGTAKTYTVVVTRLASSNADLASLNASAGNISPGFTSAVTAYQAMVANNISYVTITPVTSDSTATVTVNGTTVTSGATSTAILLSIGSNTIATVVTAQDGTIKTYTIVITRAASANADLANLVLSTGSLSPTFAGTTTAYTALVQNNINSLTVTPTLSDTTATVEVNSTAVINGTASASIPLVAGNNTITIVVTAQNGGFKTYSIAVTRAAGTTTNAELTNLTLSSGTLSPAFSGSITSYDASVPYATTTLRITPTAANTTSVIKVNGTTTPSGKLSGFIFLNVGLNTINTVVNAKDGTTKTYTVVVNRLAKANPDLVSLVLSSGQLTPRFNPLFILYGALVSTAVNNLTLTPTAADATATIKVNGRLVSNGGLSALFPLNFGLNSFITEVTTPDGSSKTYVVIVERPRPIVNVHNIFTPNGDGINDKWKIENIELFADCAVKVVDRFNRVIFSSEGYPEDWDGQAASNGVYYYYIDLKHGAGILTGSVTIVR